MQQGPWSWRQLSQHSSAAEMLKAAFPAAEKPSRAAPPRLLQHPSQFWSCSGRGADVVVAKDWGWGQL